MENKTISNLIGMFDKKPSSSLSNNNLSSITSSNLQTSNTPHNNPSPHYPQSLQDSVVMRARNMEQKNKPPYQKHNTSSYSTPISLSLNDPFQDEYTYLTPVTIPHSIFNPTFCEAFIIVSFPLTNGEPTPSSTFSPPPCNHFLCSKLPAMKPAILFNYPENPPNIEINSIIASICFPEGIRVCHGNPMNQHEPPPQLPNVITSISNQSADRFYLISSTFYFKILIDQFNSEIYKTHPASIYKEQLFKEVALNGATLTEKQSQELEHVNALFSTAYVYVPYSFILLSRYPYINQMKQCLISIKNIFDDKRFELHDIVDIIKHLIREIPVPQPETKINFYLPFIYPIELLCPYEKDYLLLNQNITCIYTLKPEHIITIFKLILYEQRILFIDDDLEKVFNIINAFLALIYPFQWVNPIIPIITLETMKYMTSIVPFIYGMSKSLYRKTKQTNEEAFKMKESVYLVKIYSNEIVHLLNGDKHKINIPSLSNDIEETLLNGVKEILSKRKCNNDNDMHDIGIKTRVMFFMIMHHMFNDLPMYVHDIDNNHIFNQITFLDNKPKTTEDSYKLIFQAQNFQMLVQNTIQNKNGMLFYDNNITPSSKATIIDDYLIQLFTKHFQQQRLSLYVVKPPFIDENLLSQNATTPSHYENTVSLMYPYETDKHIITQFTLPTQIAYDTISYYKYPDSEILMEQPKKKSKHFTGKLKFFNNCERKNSRYKELFEKRNKNMKLTEQEIKEIIKEVLTSLFSSKHLSKDINLLNELLSRSETPFSKEYIVQVLYQEGKNLYPKILSTDSFSFFISILTKLIQYFFNEDKKNVKNIKMGIKTIIISQMYFAYFNNNETFIFQYMKMSLTHFENVLISELFVNEFIQVKIETVNINSKGLSKKEKEDYIDQYKEMAFNEAISLLRDIEFDKMKIYQCADKVLDNSKTFKAKDNKKEKMLEVVKLILGIDD